MASQFSHTNSPHKELTINDLPLLCNTLNPVAPKYFDLGLQLAVKDTKIRIIMANNTNNCETQLREIITERLKQDSPLTWHDIVTALRSPSVNHHDLARVMESWYISPSVDLSQHPSSDLQQYLSLGGERPYHMVTMGQMTVDRRENPNMDMISVATSSLLGAPFSTQIGTPYYQPPTLMMDQTPVGGPPGFQSPSIMSGLLGRGSQSPVRGPSDRGHYKSQSPVRGPSDRGHFKSQSRVRGPADRGHYKSQSPVRGPSDRGNCRSQSPVRGPSDRGHYRSQSPVRGAPDRGQYRSKSPVRGPSDRGHYRSRRGPSDWGPYRSRLPVRGSSHRGHYRPQSPVRGPSDRGPYRSRLPVRESSDRGHYRPQSPVRGPSDRGPYRSRLPVRESSDRGHYRPQSPVRGPSDRGPYRSRLPVRESSDRGHYRPQSPVRGPSDRGPYRSRLPVRESSDRGHYRPQSPVRRPSDRGHYRSQSPVRRPSDRVHYRSRRGPSDWGHYQSQEGVVGGQWDRQSYMSHSQPHTSHTNMLSSDSCPPPPRRFNLHPKPPFTESSTASNLSKSAHHRSPMDTFVHYVKLTYKQCEIEKNLNVLKWPPTPSKIFIKLACIDWESVVSKEEADEYTRAMVEDGNVDVIMKKKTNIDFSDIVRDLPPVTASEKVVLVEGPPGVGKSTFAWEFCRRWERGEIAQQYQLVLLLQLRDERTSGAMSLRDLIYHSSESVCQAVVEELESTFGVNTLIILEGFDELPHSQRNMSSIFLQLILGRLLLHATIMITSRPWATGALLAQFKHRIFLHVEILGFTEENITKYVTSVFTGEGKKTASAIGQSVGGQDEVSEEAKKNIDDVMAYIVKYPQIKACMYIPLNAAIVVSIYRESTKSKWVLPTTLTELYESLTRILLLRYIRGHAEYSHQKWSVKSFEDLPREVYSQLLVISKIAYDGVCKKGGISVQLIFSDIPDDFETLGLMQSVSQLFMDGQKTSHNFLHLTFQEFLAAFLISTMSPAEQLKHFQRHEDGRLRVVLRFLAGLTKLNKVTPDQLRSLLGEPTVEQSDEHQTQYCNPMRTDVCVSAHHTNWLFEAQNSELIQSLFHNHTASFTFTRGMLPLEHYSVGYCIAHSHSKWSLTFDEHTEEEKLHILVSGAKTGDGDYRVAVKMTPENMNILVNGFSSHVEELYYLKIPDNGNSLFLPPLSTLLILELQVDNNKSAFNISCGLSFSSLEALIISSSCEGTTLGAKTCKAIGKLLSSTTSLKKFCLSLNIESRGYSAHVSSNGMEVITKGLSDNIALPLKCLDIDCKCTFTTTVTRSLVQFITRSTSLQYFKIHIDTFKDVDIFAKGLSDNIALPLKSLDIDCKCTFTTTVARSLVQFITRNTTLQYIRICHVTFSAQGLIELTEALHHSSRLQEKKLEKLTFRVECSEDVVNLRHMIKDHPDILKSITDWDGVTNVVCLLFDEESKASIVRLGLGCSQDTSLSLGRISIGDAGAVALAQALHHNSTLKNLYLSNINISDAGAVALALALHHNSTLKLLDLSNNNINDAGAVALAHTLHHNSTLERLYLYGNDAIGKEGTHQLVQALTVNTSITKVTRFVGGLKLPRRCKEYATQCIQYNTVKNRIIFF